MSCGNGGGFASREWCLIVDEFDASERERERERLKNNGI